MDPIVNDPKLKWIAKEWEDQSDNLANWALTNLVNRYDVWGQYTEKSDVVGKSISVVTLPVKDLRGKGDMVSFDKLKRHFRGRKPSDLIGLHCISEKETCRWFAIDLDVHDEKDSSYFSKVNFEAMLNWSDRFRQKLLDPCLIDSNGMGSYHLLVLLDKPYPLELVYDFLSTSTGNFGELRIENKPELFPSSKKLKSLGKWLRMPGRHHTRPHFSKVWSDDLGGKWLEGIEAIEALMGAAPMPLPSFEVEKNLPNNTLISKPNPDRHAACVDLDGLLAYYEEWTSIEHIGEPIQGAKEFLVELKKKFRVIIYTARFSNSRIKDFNDIQQLKNHIELWLRKNSMEFDEVFTGTGKPLASVFVDDRAVECRPQEDKEAFNNALLKIDKLTKSNRSK